MSSNVIQPSGSAAGERVTGFFRTGSGIQRAVIAALSVVYLLQAFTPIRLDNDSVVYLRMAASMVDGLPVESTGLPAGYPMFIAVLDHLGLGQSFVFVLANCVFVAMGLVSTHYLFAADGDWRAMRVVALTMLAVPLIRYLPMHLPECMFFGISLAAVALMNAATQARGARRAGLLVAAMTLTAIAILVRLVGFALIPAFLWACLHGPSSDTASSRQSAKARGTERVKWISIAAVLAIVAVTSLMLGDSFRKYASEAGLQYLDADVGDNVAVHLLWTLRIVGEVAINLPGTQFSAYSAWFLLAGVIATLWVVVALRWRVPRTPAGVYLVCFVLLLVMWPYNALRLWLPIVPLLIGYIQTAPLRFGRGRFARLVSRAYVVWFALVGLAALMYTTRITLSGSEFPKLYGRAGGMSVPDPVTGRVDTLHNRRVRELTTRYGNSF